MNGNWQVTGRLAYVPSRKVQALPGSEVRVFSSTCGTPALTAAKCRVAQRFGLTIKIKRKGGIELRHGVIQNDPAVQNGLFRLNPLAA